MDGSVGRSKRQVMLDSPLGDELSFHRLEGHERLAQPFRYEVEALSENDAIAAGDILGHRMTVKVEVAPDQHRSFDGYVTHFSREGVTHDRTRYRATLEPWFALLSQASNCRIFQNESVLRIVERVFDEHAEIKNFDRALQEDYSKLIKYAVQYRESDFTFVTRLLEDAGIYYFFRHTTSGHELILADGPESHTPAPTCEELPYYPRQGGRKSYCESWESTARLCSGRYVLGAFRYKEPALRLTSDRARPMPHRLGNFEMFDYPSWHDSVEAGEAVAALRLQELQAEHEVFSGFAHHPGLAVGHTFKLCNHPRQDLNREYLLCGAHYRISDAGYTSGANESPSIFECNLQAIEKKVRYVPRRSTAKPIIPGPQTATVVGPKGQEIWTDHLARVKVQFHWDRDTQPGENRSCWIRVAQALAGNRWGSQCVPRIGQEVVVEFLEGDPDRPLVVAAVYNGDHKPPYRATQSGLRTHSTKNAAPEDFNELRFDDQRGAEEVFIQAQRDLRTNVKHDRSTTIGHDDQITIGNAREVTAKTIKETGEDGLVLTVQGCTIEITRSGIALSALGSSITLTASGITIKGVQVRINDP